MKKVLIISYYFPPSGGAGVQRVLKFVKYLPAFGWEPVVLTVREHADFPARDSSLFGEITPETRIYRTRIFEPYDLYRKFTGKTENTAIDISTNTQEERLSPGERLSSFIRATFFVPDARRFWKGPAVLEGKKIIRREKIDLIFSSAPPYTCHLIGRALKSASGLPWVADFRDSWVGWLSTPGRWFLPHRVDLGLEGGVLRQADRLLAVSAGVRDDLASRHPDVPESKWTLLTNGFDSADFEGLQSRPDPHRFMLTYTGSLYGKRNPLVLLDALDRLLSEKPGLKEKLLLRFIGRADESFVEAFRKFGKLVEYIPYVPHRQSLQFLMDSSALLLIIDDAPANRSIATGKLYEYIGAGKPVLALAPEGAAADLIRSLDAGIVVTPGNREGIRDALSNLIHRWQSGTLSVGFDRGKTGRYERKKLTGELAGLFDRLVVRKTENRS